MSAFAATGAGHTTRAWNKTGYLPQPLWSSEKADVTDKKTCGEKERHEIRLQPTKFLEVDSKLVAGGSRTRESSEFSEETAAPKSHDFGYVPFCELVKRRASKE